MIKFKWLFHFLLEFAFGKHNSTPGKHHLYFMLWTPTFNHTAYLDFPIKK